MRVNSGKYKGRRLLGYVHDEVRATKGIVKESITGMLSFDIKDAKVLDLFAGTGSIGIELLSMGAKELVLNDKNTVEILKQNTSFIEEEIEIYDNNALTLLKKIKEEGRKFDIIFLDPPYQYEILPRVIQRILHDDILAKDGLLVIEQAMDEEDIDIPIPLIKTKRFGGTKVAVYKNDNKKTRMKTRYS